MRAVGLPPPSASFVEAANRICNRRGRTIKPLVKKLVEPAGTSFKSLEAVRLKTKLEKLTWDLGEAPSRSSAKNAHAFVEGYSKQVRTREGIAIRLGALSDDYYDNLDTVIPLSDKVLDKAIELSPSTGDVGRCCDISAQRSGCSATGWMARSLWTGHHLVEGPDVDLALAGMCHVSDQRPLGRNRRSRGVSGSALPVQARP